MSIEVFLGPALLSDFRREALNRALAQASVSLAESRALYLAHWRRAPTPAERETLAALLASAEPAALAGEQLLVAPRLGTVSPWSSKATDIARVCGLDALERLEFARRLTLPGWAAADEAARSAALSRLHDPLTETVLTTLDELPRCFEARAPEPLVSLPLGEAPKAALEEANRRMGLALSDAEMAALAAHYAEAGRDPSDAELMMYAQIHSEHCRHKIFNARWTRDGEDFPHSLFAMIRMTHAASPEGVLSAYSDNAAVLAAAPTRRWVIGADGRYGALDEPAAIAIKVETHNHPTAIAPDPGAATGSGGEIRDEAATGRGGKPKAGLCGFSVANLNIPGHAQPWEHGEPAPGRLASALDIMRDGPLGAARYNNEFGRPNLAGYFRTLDVVRDGRRWGYAKPIMIAGGLGNLRPQHADKAPVPPGSLIVVLGGPGMLIGLGGGAASSVHAGASSEELDFASVQRANPELERRCQEVIDACWTAGEANPILSIHDVGAGGLSNAVPEILDDNDLGGEIDLDAIPRADSGLSPMELWCNESQERYVLAIAPEDRERFAAICARERCPWAVIGSGTAEPRLVLRNAGCVAVDLPMAVLLGKQPPLEREATRLAVARGQAAWASELDLAEALERVLRLPAVAAKSFLITIGDRSVGGLVCRDQFVGPWQVPVADVAVTAAGYEGPVGEAMAMGERSPIAITNAPASGRMAVAEALTNIAAAPVDKLSDVRLSANWMAAAGEPDQASALLATVEAVGKELCTALGVAIPVGKDSLSMQTRWQTGGNEHSVTAPVSLVVSAFAPVSDVAAVLTPELARDAGETQLVLIEPPGGHRRLGGSALAQVYDRDGGATPDLEDPQALAALFALIQALRAEGRLLAYHDVSDGGPIVALLEMAFAARCGLDIRLPEPALLPRLFAEEVGAVVQLRTADVPEALARAGRAGLAATVVATPRADQAVTVGEVEAEPVFRADARALHRAWAETSYRMQALRDEPACAREEFDQLLDADDPGLNVQLGFEPAAPAVVSRRPPVAILREQGVNGQLEMAWMFERAGFAAHDVHMSDLLAGRRELGEFVGLAACGGFSYGDVLGAGRGWARSILLNPRVREQFAAFLADQNRFALGVCNGCQMLAVLAELIPGTGHWPQFVGNRSEQFEARLSLVEIPENRSVFLSGMAGSRLPIAVAHGEGRAAFAAAGDQDALAGAGQVALRYVDSRGAVTERFPANPNGSPGGVTGLCNADGRVTVMMPHPERLTRAESFSWRPRDWRGESPWLTMFAGARAWVGD